MVIEDIFLGFAVLGGVIGSVNDFKSREMPNWINYFLFIFGFLGNLVLAALSKDFGLVLSLFGSVVLFLIVGSLFFYSGQWGGGDFKYLVAVSALVPRILIKPIYGVSSIFPLSVILLLNIICAGAVYGIFMNFFYGLRQPKKYFGLAFGRIRGFRWIFILGIFGMVVGGLLFSNLFFMSLFFASVFLVFVLLLYCFLKSTEEVLYRRRRVDRLVLGDWLRGRVRIGKKVIGPRKTGLSEEDLKVLQEAYRKGKIKEVWVKEGIPFVPAILLGLVLYLVFGDVISLAAGWLLRG